MHICHAPNRCHYFGVLSAVSLAGVYALPVKPALAGVWGLPAPMGQQSRLSADISSRYRISGIIQLSSIRPGIRYPVGSGILYPVQNNIRYFLVFCIRLNLISGIIWHITNCCQTPPPLIFMPYFLLSLKEVPQSHLTIRICPLKH